VTAITLPAPAMRVRPGAPPARATGQSRTHYRLMIVMLLFLGAAGVCALRIGWLAVLGDRGAAQRTGGAFVPARADILDRNGLPLARTIKAWSIAIHPDRLLNDPEDLAPRLAALMPERSEAQYLAMLRSGKPFFYLRRRAAPELVEAVNALGETAIELGREPERLYPQTTLASHVLGYTNMDGHGVGGIEGVLDGRLTDPAKRNTPVELSIDSRVQAAMESELQAAMVRHSAIGAAGLVLDARTGEIVALASLPSFNPNAAGRYDPAIRYNKATMGVYELGSTFKAITVAAGLEAGVITSMSKRYDATAPLQVGRYRIRDDHPQDRFLDVPEMMVHSSNIVTARIADELGQRRMSAMFNRLGFNRRTDVELAEKSRPLWPGYWGRTTTMTVGYGHGIAVTPLHLANAYAALVNGGILRPVTLLKRAPGQVPAGQRVLSEATSFRVRQLLRLVVMKGTGRKADAPGFRLGGKTGTGEKPQAGGYSRDANVTTFAGVFPLDDPKYVVIAMLDSPKGTAETYGFRTAGWNVAPVVSRVVSRIGPLLGVVPDENTDIDVSELLPLLWEPKGASGDAPD
jgi:cell division protein FtsI (penicillin-binding protein 3)